MTCTAIGPEMWQLVFTEPETIFITNILRCLERHYSTGMDQLSPMQRKFWQGSVSAQPEKGEEMEASDELLAEARADLRSERLTLAQNWLRDFELAEDREPWTVDATTTERDEFVAMLNDRRLLVALEIGITDAEMEMDPDKISDELRRTAVFEIDVLGHFIVTILGPQIYRS